MWSATKWIEIRTPMGSFTHCGLCDYLKLITTTTRDESFRQAALTKLVAHWRFQAAQRVAMNVFFEQSAKDPTKLVCVAWDKMNQTKTMVPRIKGLSNTGVYKQGPRLEVSLFGAHCPAFGPRPMVYTLFKDHEHGADMVGSIMVDFLLQVKNKFNTLPETWLIQADNTPKETKNTITLFVAAYLMAHLQHTPLQSIEFIYLMMGHTHDFVDAMFAYVGKSLHGVDFHSVPALQEACLRRMTYPPVWSHLRDVYNFGEVQPGWLSSAHVVGTGHPHHFKLYWSPDGHIMLKCKRWMTDVEWDAPCILVSAGDRMRELLTVSPTIIHPEWPQGLGTSSLAFFGKLQQLYTAMGVHRFDGELAHTMRVLRHEILDYLPSGVSIAKKLAFICKDVPVKESCGADALFTLVNEAVRTVFKGSDVGSAGSGLRIRGSGSAGEASAAEPYCQSLLATDMFILYRPAAHDDPYPIRFGRVLRAVLEHGYLVVESWYPILKDEHEYKPNVFGTWLKRGSPLRVTAGKPQKRSKTDAACDTCMISVDSVLVWPVTPEPGNEDYPDGVRIPFAAFHYLRDSRGVDLSGTTWSWSKRGRLFWDQLIKRIGAKIRSAQGTARKPRRDL